MTKSLGNINAGPLTLAEMIVIQRADARNRRELDYRRSLRAMLKGRVYVDGFAAEYIPYADEGNLETKQGWYRLDDQHATMIATDCHSRLDLASDPATRHGLLPGYDTSKSR